MLKDFIVFQRAKAFYLLCKELKTPPFLKDQLLRASSSVALNIAEGSGKRTAADQKRYYSMALGSLRECQAIIAIEEINQPALEDLTNQLGAMLFKLSH